MILRKNNKLPRTTLFLLESVDGKISTGMDDRFDFDKDIPNIPGARDGLQQYYDIEQETDLWSLCTGRVQEKVLSVINKIPNKTPVTFVILDNSHLSERSIEFLSNKAKKLYIATNNKNHIATQLDYNNMDVILYERNDFVSLFETLYDLGCKDLTVQSGGELNRYLLNAGLIDKLNIVISPILVGGKNTPSLVSGPDIESIKEIVSLKLIKINQLKNNYIQLLYNVI